MRKGGGGFLVCNPPQKRLKTVFVRGTNKKGARDHYYCLFSPLFQVNRKPQARYRWNKARYDIPLAIKIEKHVIAMYVGGHQDYT